jgi:heptosyltransferase I
MSYKSILIIKPSSLGDIVHTLPAVAAIREANPSARITWVINPEWAPLLRGNRDIDHVHIFPRGEFRGLGASRSLLPWLKKTRALQPDVAIDFQGLLRSALIARMSGARELFGLSDAREGSRFFYHHTARVDRRAHAVERYLALAETFGAPLRGPARFPLPTGDELPRFDEHEPFLLLHPFARGRGKSLTDRAVREFCNACAPNRVVLVGKSKLRVKVPDNCIDVTNQTTLLQLLRLIRMASFVVSVDSGPMHIAAAITDKLVSIHTWTDPRRVGPYNPDAWIWRNGELQQMRDFAPAGKLPRGRRFRRADLPPLVELVSQYVTAPAQ